MDENSAQNHVMMMQGASSGNVAMLGMGSILQEMAVGNPSSDMRHSSAHNIIPKQDQGEFLCLMFQKNQIFL